MKLRMWGGSLKIITEVRHIHDLKRTLIFLSTLEGSATRLKIVYERL